MFLEICVFRVMTGLTPLGPTLQAKDSEGVESSPIVGTKQWRDSCQYIMSELKCQNELFIQSIYRFYQYQQRSSQEKMARVWLLHKHYPFVPKKYAYCTTKYTIFTGEQVRMLEIACWCYRCYITHVFCVLQVQAWDCVEVWLAWQLYQHHYGQVPQ